MRGATSASSSKDIEGIITLLIDAEMKMFDGPADTPVVFLQNVVVDFLLGMGFNEAFRIFADHVSSRYNAESGLHHDEHADGYGAALDRSESRTRS